MKTLAFLLITILSICFVASASHNRHNGRKGRVNEEPNPGAGNDVEWPSPASINDFTVPDEYTGGVTVAGGDGQDPGNGNEVPPVRHHGTNHRTHRH